MIVLEEYLGSYLEVRLSNSFLVEVCRPVIQMIDFFESNSVRVQYRYEKLVMLLFDFLSKFAKDAGVTNNNDPDGKALLKARYRGEKNQLSNKEIWLGKKVEALLLDLSLTRESEELQVWIMQVRAFYEAAVDKMIKYFGPGIESKTLKALSVLDPKVWRTKSQDHIKKQFRILGEKFNNVIEILELPDLMIEISQVCYLMRSTEGLEGVEKGDADGFMSALHGHEDIEGSPEFPLLTKLGSSCCTVYNSSSPAERDFSHMNEMVGGGGSKNRTSQELLLAKMTIKAEINMLARKCLKCKVLKEKDQKSYHCHCHLFSPPEELMETMRGGQPHKRYQMALEKAAAENKDKEVLKALLEEEDKSVKDKNMKDEVLRLQKRCLERKKAVKKAAKEKEAKEKEKKKQSTTHVSFMRYNHDYSSNLIKSIIILKFLIPPLPR
jgi:hypothetical protein